MTETASATQETDDLDRLWEAAKAVEMSEEAREEQTIRHLAATGNMSDPRITVETMRASRTLMRAADTVIPK